MLPQVLGVFTVVQQLARRAEVGEITLPHDVVRRHGLAPMLGRAGIVAYRDDLARAALDWAVRQRVLEQLAARFRSAGVRVCPIKGASYAMSLYNLPGERPMNDIDLLVMPQQWEAAERVLQAEEFQRGRHDILHHAEPWIRDGMVVDLHWNIIGRLRSRIDLEAIWSRTTAGAIAGTEQLDPTDALVFHLLHLARNRLTLPLINVVDAARLLEHASVATTHERARAWHVSRAVARAYGFCAALLEGDVAAATAGPGPSARELEQLVELSLRQKLRFDVTVSESWAQLAGRAAHVAANRLRRLARRSEAGSFP